MGKLSVVGQSYNRMPESKKNELVFFGLKNILKNSQPKTGQ